MNRAPILLVAGVLLTGCAIRLGGPKPETYRTMALAVEPGTAAAEVARRIRQADADAVLVSAAGDSAWFAELASTARLHLSGPGSAGPVSLAFLAGEALGDTTLALPVEGGDDLVVHDALYRVDDHRYLDLLAVRLEPGRPVRPAVKALLSYIATDVMHGAAVVLAVDAPDAASAEEASSLLSPAFEPASSCFEEDGRGSGKAGRMLLFFGPATRMRCEEARLLDEGGASLLARLVVRR